MKPVAFKGTNIILGEGQKQYQPLPVLRLEGEEGQIISCWELSDEDLAEITKTRRVYASQLTFNHPLQPLVILADLSDMIRIQ